ncbi:MAG: diguanylate cyclase domain-containing protein [Phormidesmis sp.]
MSILSEQSAPSQGPHSSGRAGSHQSTPLGPTALPVQPAADCTASSPTAQTTALTPSKSISQPDILSSPASEPLSASLSASKQQQLQQLCQNAALYNSELTVATAVITKAAVEIIGADRASLWFYDTDDCFKLSNRYDATAQAHSSDLKIAIAEHTPYIETLSDRDCLLIEDTSQMQTVIRCLIQANLLLAGAFLEVPIRVRAQLVGFLWCERKSAYQWSALEQASAVSIALLSATTFDSQQQRSLTHTLSHHRRQLKRETIEREQAEQAWQESQRFIQGIIDASTNILYVDSFADGSNFYINRWIQNVLGYTPGDLQQLGPHYLEQLVHADDKALMAAERRKLSYINDGEVVENEYRFRHRRGNWRWLLCRETVFQRDVNGQPTQIFGTATDITKRKHAEVALKEFNEELERLARMDGLTQVANRRSFDEHLEKEWENVKNGGSALSLILCDIDYFKSFNDTYGHQAGDVCLKKVAKVLEKAVKRNTDRVARYGGEEFAIILPNTNLAGLKKVAIDIQTAVKQLGILHSQSEVSDYVTLSLGLSLITSTKDARPDMLIAAADQGLYQAKYEGRDRFCLSFIEGTIEG